MSYAFMKSLSAIRELAVVKSPSIRRYGGITALCFISFYLVIVTFQRPGQVELVNTSNEDYDCFTLQHCGCKRCFKRETLPSNPPDLSYNQTTCSYDAFRRGPNQKIIGFSFYGNIDSDYSKKKGYFEGIVGNLELMPKFYPGWTMRLYYDLDKKDPVLKDLCDLACRDSNIDICDAKHLPGTPFVDASKVFAMNWRFFPTLDPQVDVFLSRDLDSRFSFREVAAVNEWLNTKSKAIHAMRDNPAHRIGLLGASWGTDLTKDNGRGRWKKTWEKMFQDPETFADRSSKGPDQEILQEYVWRTWGKRSSVQHDSFFCEKFTGSIGFPTQRLIEKNNYVAAVWNDGEILKKKCPKPCRRYPDWIHC